MDSKLRARTFVARASLVVVAIVLTACSYSSKAGPHSGPAVIGAPQRIGLWDCEDARAGLTVADFDQSLWLPVGRDPAELVSLADIADVAADTGSITLVAPDLAEYRSDRGPVFTFARHGDTFTFEGCVPWMLTLDEG